MRRGHLVWRNDNPRHFRPRNGGTPHFRPSRGYGRPDGPRFQSPGPRPLLPTYLEPPPYSYRGKRHRGGSQDWNHYSAQGPRQIYPILNKIRHGDVPDHTSYQDIPNYYDNNQQPWETINSMGDFDHHQGPGTPHKGQRIQPWSEPPFNYEDRNFPKPFRHQDNMEHNKIPQPDYTGHRPPASDHYGGNQGSTMDNSNTFSRSVDDTVDIVRKRLLNRESQPPSEEPNLPIDQNETDQPEKSLRRYSNPNQDQPIKKKQNKQRNMKSNCDKIKNKIVHQLIMMDKDKIHKLMDNPNSSSKFEYAISSLVTESRNSFNRHLRSVAEKSLCGPSSSEFVHNDNNTIYEDTFMKQMEGILDPQDTVFLEDIKPIVLAELSKVLQLDDLQLRQEEEEASYARDKQSQYDQYTNDSYNDNYVRFSPAVEDDNYYGQNYEKPQTPDYGQEFNQNYEQEHKSKPLFERRKQRRSGECSHSRRSSEERRRKVSTHLSVDNVTKDCLQRSGGPRPLFDSNAEHISEDEDPFAELDRQYHVAVDHNFIKNDYLDTFSPEPPNTPQPPVVKKEIPNQMHTPEKAKQNTHFEQAPLKSKDEKPASKIKEEIDNQLQDMANTPLKLVSPTSETQPEVQDTGASQIRPPDELSTNKLNNETPEKQKKLTVDINTSQSTPVSQEHYAEPQITETTPEKSKHSTSVVKPSTPTDSRKRSSDQKPSHRKEKRKKSEPSPPESHKQILNKNIIIHVSDCAAKTSDNSFYNLYFSKENNPKESVKEKKKSESSDKKYSDKYVKRKENDSSSKKSDKKKHDSSSSSHSILSPDINNASSAQSSNKSDSQTKLKPIDIFTEPPKKPIVHQAHRNTAVPVTTPNKTTPVELKPVVISRKMTKRHIATQVSRKCLSKEVQTVEIKSSKSRFSQTEKKKFITRGAQTEPVSFKPTSKSTDSFERMKEIDMEIQALLQEKFKLYNSLESKESGPNTMQSLGMAVLNVAPGPETIDDHSISEDMIVDEFTNIPVEELEKIALETVQEEQNTFETTDLIEKSNRRKKKMQETGRQRRTSSQSTNASTPGRRTKRCMNTPNISLIEQIITDDRPLEDIISLDDLELLPPSKKKAKKEPKKKVSKKKVQKAVPNEKLKECSVVLKREDLNKLLQKLKKAAATNAQATREVQCTYTPVKYESRVEIPESTQKSQLLDEESVLNDIQFDMLDVSEDIVIGDVCEVKFSEEKETSRDSTPPAICEEIILDNSQSSVDSAALCETGGECRMYDYSTDENLRRDAITVTGNGDAVLAIECVDTNFIAACLNGNVYYFSGDGKLLSTLKGSNLAVTCVTIVKETNSTTVYTGSLDSRIRYYDLETGVEKGPECNVLSPIQTMDRAWDTVFVGTRTGFVLQFECKNNQLIPVSTVKFSDQSILALRAMKEGPRKVLLVAARFENVTVKDAQSGLLLRTLEGPKMTVYTVLYEEGKVYCGTSSNQIHVFDYASGSHIGSHSGGKGAVCLRAASGLVFAGCYDGCVYVYRETDATPLAQLRGPSLMLLSLAITGNKIIAGYKDRSLYIWKIPDNILREMIL